MAAWVLATPPPMEVLDPLPKRPLFQAVPGLAPGPAPGLAMAATVFSHPEADLLGSLLDQLAVVRPHRSGRHAPPSLQMFIGPAAGPRKGQVGLTAFGSF